MTPFGPTLTTARLTLRLPQAGDEHHLLDMLQAEETRAYLGPVTLTLSDSFARNVRNAGGWLLYGFSNFMMVETATGAFAGSCGLFRIHREFGADFDGCPEAGWIVHHDHAGRGYAKEAMGAIHDWFDATHGRQRTTALIDSRNAASQSVARALGYRIFRSTTMDDDPVDLWERV